MIDRLENVLKREGSTNRLGLVGWFFLFGGLVLGDQLLKGWVFRYCAGLSDAVRWFLRPVLGLRLFYNDQFAFSLAVPHWLMYLLYSLIVGGVLWYVYKNFYRFFLIEKIAWVLILAGGFANIGERLVYGSVRDFLYIYGGAIINLADLYIFLGIGLICLREIYPHVSSSDR